MNTPPCMICGGGDVPAPLFNPSILYSVILNLRLILD